MWDFFQKDKEANVPTTLFASTPITTTPEYDRIADRERFIMIIVLIIQALLGPLIFRYMMGSRTSAEDDATVGWASKMDAWEWGIITVLFLGFIGSLMRLLPFVGGRPSSLESSQKVDLDGAASLGICSPFASEDDTILLRSLLGRTCTVFHTVGSRHDIQGLYVDAILNEKRIKGENGRRALWVAWMSFLTSLVDVCYLIEEERNSGKSDEVAEKLSLKQNWAGTQFDYDPEIFPDSSIDSLDFRGRGLTIGKNNRRMTVGSMRGGPEQIRTTFSSFGEVGYAIHAGLMSSDNLTETIDKWADDRFSALSSKVTASMDHNQPRDEENNNGISLSTQSHGFGSFSRLRSTSQQFASPAQKKVQHRIFLPTIMSLSDYNFTDVSGHVDEDDDRSDLKKRASRALSPIKDSIDVGDSSQEEGRDRTNSKGKTVTINANKSYSDEVVDDSNDIVDDNPNLLKRRSYYEMKKLGMAPLNRSDSEENYGQVISTPRAWSTKKTATVEDPTVSPLTPRVDESPTASNDGGLFIDAHDLGNMLSSKDYLDSRGRGYSSMFYSSKLPGGESTREYGALRRAFSRSSSKAIPNSRSVGIASSISDDTGSLALGQNLKVFQMNTKLFSTDNDLAEGSDEDQDNSDNSGEKKTFTNFSKTRIEKDAVPEDAKFANSHGLPSLKVEMETIVPMIEFLDAWLEEMKSNEWTYDFTKPRLALEKLFFASPFMKYFNGKYMLAVHAALDTLYKAFVKPTADPDEVDHKLPVHRDDINEIEWTITRVGFSPWTIAWCFLGRSKLRQMDRTKFYDPFGPDPVFQTTRIKPGAVVYQKLSSLLLPTYIPAAFVRNRAITYKVDYIKSEKDKNTGKWRKMAYVYPFPQSKSDLEAAVDSTLNRFAVNGNKTDSTNSRRLKSSEDAKSNLLAIPFDSLSLIELNRGKTGALNFFNDYLRARTAKWNSDVGLNHPVQTFTGIIDARHALVETDIFWNDALPYFSLVQTTGEPGKRFGSLTNHSVCIMVQYPQFFVNLNSSNDTLDNTNSSYYRLWQTLRDGAKCVCSSGTNAIWDISDPSFLFCTKSRSEDLGTSHQFIEHSAAVYLCINVAYGVAKQTEDYIEALYRWSAGPLELLWISFFDWNILKHYINTAIPCTITVLASFGESSYWYFIYLGMLLIYVIQAIVDRMRGRKALRSLAVSTTVSINLFIVCSNLVSCTWYIFFPLRIAFYGILPMTKDDTRALFWGFISIFFALPTGVFYDSIIRIARYNSPSLDFNYDRSLWRGSQLYATSFMFTLMATIAGSYSAFKAYWYDYDLSMWSSFRVSNSQFDKITNDMKKLNSCFSVAYLFKIWEYINLYLTSCIAQLTMPTVMTRWYVTSIYIFQYVCIIVSTLFVNRNDLLNIIVLLFVCGVNIMALTDAAFTLQPLLKRFAGFPLRMEYVFGYMGLFIIVTGIITGALSVSSIRERVRLEHLKTW